MKEIKDIERQEIEINVLGINHFTWLDKASYKNMDLLPLYKEFVDKYYKTGFETEGEGNWLNSYFESAERVKFDLFKRYGLIAAAGDRHLAEFVPSSWYLKDPETVKQWKFSLTPVSWRKERQKKLNKKAQRLVNGEEEFDLETSGEEGVRQIKALLGLGDLVTNVNFPNRGQMKGIPEGTIVETNALFRKDQLSPVVGGSLPGDVNNLVMTHVLNQETIVKSVLNQDLELAFNAFISDPLVVGAGLDRNEAKELFNRMVDNTKEYIPWL